MKRTASAAAAIFSVGSALENMSAHLTLAALLEVYECARLRRCSHKFSELYKLAFLSSARWTEDCLLSLNEQERAHVRCLDLADWKADYVFPPRLTSFSFETEQMHILPNTLTELRFGDLFNHNLAVGVLPPSLVSVAFGDYFDCALMPGVLPSGVDKVIFRYMFNQKLLPGTLPTGLRYLKFGKCFNQPLWFTNTEGKEQSLLPASLTKLKLGNNFNDNLLEFLPSELSHLVFDEGAKFDRTLTPLPPKLATLWLGLQYFSLPDKLPATLTKLRVGRRFELLGPKTPLPVFPQRLTILDLGCYQTDIQPGDLPSSLLELRLSKTCNQPLEPIWLPPCLTRLITGRAVGPISFGVLPATLREIEFGSGFTTTLAPGVLSLGLTSLTFGDPFNKGLAIGAFPLNLTRLMFGFDFNQHIPPKVLPPKLLELWFGYRFNQPIMPAVLPSALCLLHGGCEFNQDLTGAGIVPLTVHTITGGNRLCVPTDFERDEICSGNHRQFFRRSGFAN